MSAERRLKLLTVIATLGPGGAERQVANLVGAHAELPVDHVVVQLGGPPDLAASIRAAGGQVVDLGVRGRSWIRAAARLQRVLRDEQPDVVKTDLFDANVATVLARLVRRRVPLVTTLHNLDYEPATIAAADLPRGRVEALRRIDRAVVHGGATYVACSQAVAESAMAHIGVPAGRMRVIHNSVDVDRFSSTAGASAAVRTELGVAPHETLLVNIGRLDPQKAQDVLLQAFAVMRSSSPARLAIVGDGPRRDELQRRARALGIDDAVAFLGVRRDIPDVLAAADVFVLPSWFEGFPVSLIEAMAAGKAIVGSRIAPIVEAVGDEAILVKAGSIDELASALHAVATDSVRRRALGDGARRSAERFRTDVIASRWHDLLLELTAVSA